MTSCMPWQGCGRGRKEIFSFGKTNLLEGFHTIAVSNNRGGISELIAKEPEHFQRVDNKIVKAINFYTKSNFPIEEGKEESDMCYATKTSEANAMIKALAKVGKSLKEIIDFIADEYPNDNDITEEYIIDEYNLVCANK